MSTESGKNAARRNALLAAVNGAAASFYSTLPGFPFRTWADVPVLAGTVLADEIQSHPPFGRLQIGSERLMRAGLATAAVPHPVPMCWSVTDLETEAQLGARALTRAGLCARGRTTDCLEGGVVTPGTLAITDALDAIDALALPVGPIINDAALTRARDVWSIVQPQMCICTLDTFDFLRSTDALPDVTYALVLTPNQATALAAPSRAPVYRVLSLPIVGTFIAGECSAHDGLHIAEDAFLAEVVDDRGSAVPDGENGRLLLSTLQRTHVVLRLETGLRASLDRAPCRCGELSVRVRIA